MARDHSSSRRRVEDPLRGLSETTSRSRYYARDLPNTLLDLDIKEGRDQGTSGNIKNAAP